MATLLRCMAAIIAGMIVALVVVVAVELFSAAVHLVPPGFKGTMEEMCLHVERYPLPLTPRSAAKGYKEMASTRVQLQVDGTMVVADRTGRKEISLAATERGPSTK